MERIDTRSKAEKAALLLALTAVAAAVAIFFQAYPERPTAAQGSPPSAAKPVPEDERLRLTVPKMARVRDLPVPTGPDDDEASLAESALHVAGTGFPWQEGANVYIAGHRIGFEGEASHLVFYDLDVLRKGDEVILEDADGARYAYRVFGSIVVGPNDYHVTYPLPGRNVVSLQTCTPVPTFERRLVVQAELADVAPA